MVLWLRVSEWTVSVVGHLVAPQRTGHHFPNGIWELVADLRRQPVAVPSQELRRQMSGLRDAARGQRR